jgi:rRNA maturation endonuclease Nob1
MIRSITKQKPLDEIMQLLSKSGRIFIVGCGTCTTLTHTGGETEVKKMKESLSVSGKVITGTTVVPVACDNLSPGIVKTVAEPLEIADTLLVMSCAFGVQTLATQLGKMVVPALDTLFIGKETVQGEFHEICKQCGTCIIGETGGICPVTSCHKGLVNGPCGGTNNGRCEIDNTIHCAWTMIYNRLKDLNRLDLMRTYQKPRNFLGEPSPGKYRIDSQ